MNDDRISPEQLAAFLEGRLRGRERKRVIEHLLESPESYELFVEAVSDLYPVSHAEHVTEWARDEALIDQALLGSTTPETPVDDDPDVISLVDRVRRSLRSWSPQYAALGAVAAAVVVGVLVVGPRLRPSDNPTASSMIVSILADGLADSAWRASQVAWPPTRGGGSGTAEDAAVARLGVYLVDLHVALTEENRVESDRILADMLGVLDDIELTQLLRQPYAAIRDSLNADTPVSRLVPLSIRADDLISRSLPSRLLRLGKWSEAARLAAVNRNSDFFRTDRARDAVAELGDVALSDSARARLRIARDHIEAGNLGDAELAAIEAAVRVVIFELGQ